MAMVERRKVAQAFLPVHVNRAEDWKDREHSLDEAIFFFGFRLPSSYLGAQAGMPVLQNKHDYKSLRAVRVSWTTSVLTKVVE